MRALGSRHGPPDHKPSRGAEGVVEVIKGALVVHPESHGAVAQLPALVDLEDLIWQ